MSLVCWLPLNGDLTNQGTENIAFTNTCGATISTAGKIGKCYSFATTTGSGLHNSSDCATFMTNHINNHSFSLCAWIKTTSTDTTVIALTYGLWLSLNSGYINITLYNSSRSISTRGTTTLSDGKWHHIVGTYDVSNNKICVYADGKLENTGTYTDGYTYASSWTNGLYIGRNPNNSTATSYYYYQGLMNDVRIYDHCLSAKEVKEISKGLCLHYKLDNNGCGNPNLIAEGKTVLGGSNSSGLTRTYLADSMRIVSDGSGSWCSCSFGSTTDSNVGSAMSVGDKFVVSYDLLIESGTGLPSIFINAGNSYAGVTGNASLVGSWQRVYQIRTWAEPGTSYGNFSLHLSFSGLTGSYQVKNFKFEKGEKPTPWSPNPSDSVGIAIGLNSNTESDGSGISGPANIINGIVTKSDSPRYNVCYNFTTSDTRCLVGTKTGTATPTDAITVACWVRFHTAISTSEKILVGNYDGGGFGLTLSSYTAGKICVQALYTGAGYKGVDSTITPNLDTWYHLTGTFDGTTTKLYINGVLDNSATLGTSISHPSGTSWAVATNPSGTSPGGQYPDADISDVRIYATALSADDVYDLFSKTASIDKAGNLHCYELVEE